MLEILLDFFLSHFCHFLPFLPHKLWEFTFYLYHTWRLCFLDFCTNGSSWSHCGVFCVGLNSLRLWEGYYTLLSFNHSSYTPNMFPAVCSGLITYVFYLSSRINHFSEEPLFLLSKKWYLKPTDWMLCVFLSMGILLILVPLNKQS